MTSDCDHDFPEWDGRCVGCLAPVKGDSGRLAIVMEAIRAELDWRHWGRPGERMQYMRRCGAQKGTSIDRCEECRPMREALATLREMLEVPTAATKKDRQWAGIKEWMGESGADALREWTGQ